jgi:diaminopimelate decarboxylase
LLIAHLAFFANSFLLAAIKANPLKGLLKRMLSNGLGAECASVEEVAHALAVGFPAHMIVYDAPAKTRSAIASAVAAGIHINLDCCEEAATVGALLAESSSDVDASAQPVFGLRVNVLVGEGAIAGTPRISQLHIMLTVTLDARARVCCIQSNQGSKSVHCRVALLTAVVSLYVVY